MTCLGGNDPRKPREWVRRVNGEDLFGRGRIQGCPRPNAGGTYPKRCSYCAAFRGRRSDGTVAGPIGPDGEWTALTREEYDAFVAASEAYLDDDEVPLQLWYTRMERGIGRWNARGRGTNVDVDEWWAAYMRRYRSENRERINARRRETRNDRTRMLDRERQRRHRLSRITAPVTQSAGKEGVMGTPLRARAREGPGQ